MGLISFGKYNNNYKYWIFYILCKLIYEFILGLKYGELYKPIYFWDEQENFGNHQLINNSFTYLGVFISSFIIKKYEPKNNKIKYESKSSLELIYDIEEKYENCFWQVVLVSFLSIFHEQLLEIYYKSNLSSLDYWALEIFTTYYIYKKIFNYQIYSHQKCSMYFASIFCSLLI